MPQGSRPDRVADQIRAEVAALIGRELRDPGLGFVTVTRVHVTPDLQIARIYYTTMGDEGARRRTAEALHRASPFVRRSMGSRLRLRRVPEIQFVFDESIEQHERIERLIQEIHESDALQQAQDVPSLPNGSRDALRQAEGAPNAPIFDDAQVDPQRAEGPTVRPDSPSTLNSSNGPRDGTRGQAAEDDEDN